MVGDEIDARKAGCDDYLPKPIDENVLLEEDQKISRVTLTWLFRT